MSTDFQTLKSLSIKKAKPRINNKFFNAPDKKPVCTTLAQTIPAFIFTVGRTLSHTELMLVQRMVRHGSIKEELIPTSSDFEAFTKLMQCRSYTHKDEYERTTTIHTNIQLVTALNDEFVLSGDEKKLVRKVIGWLALLAASEK